MVEYALRSQLDWIFAALSDPTRRDILRRVSQGQLCVCDIAKHYDLTIAAISKHLKVLENAKLITKRTRGKEHIVQLSPEALKTATDYLEFYQHMWDQRFDRLDEYLNESKKEEL